MSTDSPSAGRFDPGLGPACLPGSNSPMHEAKGPRPTASALLVPAIPNLWARTQRIARLRPSSRRLQWNCADPRTEWTGSPGSLLGLASNLSKGFACPGSGKRTSAQDDSVGTAHTGGDVRRSVD